jgi:shikimate kinase
LSGSERPVFLVGFMGSGKTTVAEALARALGWELVDTDELVVRREGREIDAIVRESGEGEFRRIEWEVLQALAGRTRTVVATGGGTPVGVAQRRFLRREGTVVWLDVPLEVCSRRVQAGPGRPLWPQGAVAARVLFEKRRAVYALADARVGAGDEPAAEVARRVAHRLGLASV